MLPFECGAKSNSLWQQKKVGEQAPPLRTAATEMNRARSGARFSLVLELDEGIFFLVWPTLLGLIGRCSF
jgi:hypothetical protein